MQTQEAEKSPAREHTRPSSLVDADHPPPTKQSKAVFIVITLALMSAIFLAALDVNILSIVIPTITTEFGSIDNVSWYGAAYSLTKMAFQPTFGKAYYLWPLKFVFLFSLALFSVGSVISAVAPNSPILIFGRAIQGTGSAGLFSGALTLAAFAVSKKRIPFYTSLLSSMYAVASLLGPIIGGYVTQSHLSWRFCFWINLPIAAVPATIITIFYAEPKRETTKAKFVDKLAGFDPIGTALLVGAITTLVLALQWAGTQFPWSIPRVWATLVASAVLVGLFIVAQVKLKERALIPMRILTQRTVALSCAISWLQIMAVTALTYYLPFYFQASKGFSPSQGGTYLLALAVPNSFFSIISGAAVTLKGLYTPWIMLGGGLLSVGSGLLSTLNQNSGDPEIVGYQILASAGFGFGVQLPLVAMLDVLPQADIPTANALYPFFQALGTSLGLAISQTIFASTLTRILALDLPPDAVRSVLDAGAAAVNSGGIPADLVPLVSDAYRRAVQDALYQSVASAGLTVVLGSLLTWKITSDVSVEAGQDADD
ncbi:MFS general substrate transporter [Astrocystis sublimbata]|nr:MFS general substrate transporter [Astrocystis sublimbata]